MPEIEDQETRTPQALMNGRFSLYEAPDGGYKIAYKVDGDGETRLLEIPGFIVTMGRLGAEGKLNPMAAMREMMKHGGTPNIGIGTGAASGMGS